MNPVSLPQNTIPVMAWATCELIANAPASSVASTARHLYPRGGGGVGAMIKIYGGRHRNGVCPSHFSVGSRNVARKVLQALEGPQDGGEGPQLNHIIVK